MVDPLELHIVETREKFTEIKSDLNDIKEKLDDIAVFKLQSIVTTRLISLIVSGAAGIITLISAVLLTYYSRQ